MYLAFLHSTLIMCFQTLQLHLQNLPNPKLGEEKGSFMPSKSQLPQVIEILLGLSPNNNFVKSKFGLWAFVSIWSPFLSSGLS